MLKIIWNWLAWQFCKGRATKLLAMSQEVVKGMDAKQKLDYAMNAVELGATLWAYDPSAPQEVVRAIRLFRKKPSTSTVNFLRSMGESFNRIARGITLSPPESCLGYAAEIRAWEKLNWAIADINNKPTNKELAYAFWSLTRMLAIVVSVATAYGHERGVRAYGKKYREMIDYGRGLVS